MSPRKSTEIVPIDRVAHSILVLRGMKVLLADDLARLYGVTSKRFNEQVRRNLARFPADFMFRLTKQEVTNLTPHFAASSWGGRRSFPHAFTEHGAIMAATILNSPRAVEMSVYIVRAFVQVREMLASNQELAKRLDELDARITQKFGACDQTIASMLEAIRELMNPPPVQVVARSRPIGFTADLEENRLKSMARRPQF